LVYFTYLPYVAGDETIDIDSAALADTVCHTMVYSGINDANGKPLQMYNPVPNPANGSAVIAFDLPKSNQASVDVLDLNGRVVLSPNNNQSFVAGYNRIELNTQKLSPGIYLVRLNVDGVQQVKKLVISR
jgi:hypothetical protein